MKRLLVLLAALGALLLFHGEALAAHFRYGTINWTVPDLQSSPLQVQFTVTYAIQTGQPPGNQTIQLFFGDGTNNGVVTGPVVGTGTDAGGQTYEVRQFTATHTYAQAGSYTAYFEACCRIAALINGGGGLANYRVDAKVVLQAGNTSGPVSASPPIIQLQIGGTRTYTWPVVEPDSDPITCRFGTAAETGFPNPIPAVPGGGQTPTLSNVPGGCQLTWDLTNAVVPQQYVVHIIFESTHNGLLSSTALDLIVEMSNAPPPTCSGGGVFVRQPGVPLVTTLTGTQNLPTTLAVSAINAPATSTLLPGGSGPSPFANTFSWTPSMADRGTARVVVVNYKNTTNLTGSCFVAVQVPQCDNFGEPCSLGVGECAATGTKVCNGIGVTVCNAVPGQPSAEICDNKDNDCDGTADDGNPGSGSSCETGQLGVCFFGTTACSSGMLQCVPDATPGMFTEMCDTLDNDCDGSVDEDFNLDATCSVGLGLCKNTGVIVCDGMGGAKCSADPLPAGVEICGDGLDNDCDGVSENGCLDSDGDGLFDDVETTIGSNPNDADTDDDGVIDGQEPDYASDTDGDGLINVLDPDSDDDGLYDGTELGKDCSNPATDLSQHHCIPDADMGATTTDPLDPDTDDGTVEDGAEDTNHNGKIDAGETDPTSGHGADDVGSANTDTDGDGLPDAVEVLIGTDPNDADSDDDGIPDGAEPNYSDDTDGDGLINALDPDSDDDGLFDGTEAGYDCSSPATNINAGHCIADGDSGATQTSPLDPDSDDGGVIDGVEDLDHDGVVDPGEIDPTAGHGADDATIIDSDGDGLSDAIEMQIGTDPNDADTDDDGVIDGQEPNFNQDTDGDGLINALDPDSDDDELFDGTEIGLDCSNPATDPAAMHCIADADPSTTTSPLDRDTDNGGATDGSEDSNHNGEVDGEERDPTFGHGGDDLNGDSDGDGLPDTVEMMIGTDPNDADTDDDGVIDGWELYPGVDSDGDGLINARDPDSDDDGLFDGTELGFDCSNPDTDLSKMVCTPDADGGATKTNPLDADTDDGGVIDGVEDLNQNGAVDPGEINPTTGHGADDMTIVDSDGDGLSDDLEDLIGTDKNDADSDDDGVIDGQEPNYNEDTDGDGNINALDPDSDDDGLFDGTEMGLDCSNPATDPAEMHCIADADPSTETSPLVGDTDGGSVKDGDEDKDHDGELDPGETDPTAGHGSDDLTMTGCDDDSDCGDAMSGMVCDTMTNMCVEGCHTPGNGCPSGEVCTSNDETIGQCVACVSDSDCGDAMSGKVCDTTTNSCVDGCHTPGNGCPSDEVCTSSDVTVGECVECVDDAQCDAAAGQVCDAANHTCVTGCRDDDDCADGQTCDIVATQTFGTCKDAEEPEGLVAEGSGILCAARPANDNSAASWLLPLAALGLLGARRRRRA